MLNNQQRYNKTEYPISSLVATYWLSSTVISKQLYKKNLKSNLDMPIYENKLVNLILEISL